MNSIFSKKTKEESTTYDTMSSLSHTKWNCKYHIVFASKCRRKIFYGEKRLEMREIIEGEVCPDHIHMLIEILPKYSVSGIMGFLKGKSSIMIYSK